MERDTRMLGALPTAEIAPETKARMQEALRLYVSGRAQMEVARDMGISKAAVCNYLHDIERRTGLKVVRDNGTKKAVKRLADVTADLSHLDPDTQASRYRMQLQNLAHLRDSLSIPELARVFLREFPPIKSERTKDE